MADNRIPSQWQLQETGETRDEWMLHEDEQRLPEHMQLQEEPYTAAPEAAWQPIDYRAMQQAATRPRGRGGAALGTLVVLALVGAAGYLTWFYLLGNGATATPTPTEIAEAAPAAAPAPVDSSAATTATVEAPPAAAEQQPAPTVEPAATLPLPTPAPAMIQFSQALVTEEYGVNARRGPSGEEDLLQVLAKDTVLPVAGGPATDAQGNSWYQVPLEDNTRAWVAAQYVTLSDVQLPFEDAKALFTDKGMDSEFANLPAVLAMAEANRVAEAIAPGASDPLTDTVAATTTTSAAAGIAQGAVVTTTEVVTTITPVLVAATPITVAGVISAPTGLFLRREPQTGDNVIELLPNLAAISIIGRSPAGDWLQVQIADGRRGWLSAPFVTAQTSLDVIPLGTTQPLTATVPLVPPAAPPAPAAESPAPSAAPAVTTTTPSSSDAIVALPTPTPVPAPTAAPATLPVAADGTVGAVSVASVLGVSVRPAPSQDSPAIAQLDWNDTALALGRTADSGWVKIRLDDGRTGWIAASAVSFPAGVGSMPVVQ